jgi:DNA primase
LPLIAQQSVQEVLSAASLHDVVASYISLKRAGSGFKALCPFHAEKTPSFNVNPSRQVFKCFGCGVGGDVIHFVKEMEKTDFAGAVALLAERYNIRLRYTGGSSDAEDPVELYRIHETAQAFFRRALEQGRGGDAARRYLKERGVTHETAERFGLGYAPAEWDGLLKRLRAAGFSDGAIRRCGLVVTKEDSDHRYDRFRDRLIFPIRNTRGKVVAFGGRLLPEGQESGGKYINSPETPIFRKSRHLYGQDLLERGVESIVVVEGYFDVILPWQHGLRGFVAPMGTAFGPDHARLVRRWSRRCTLVFDADAAGQAASERGLDLLLETDLDLSVAALPEGPKDPADVIVGRGPEALRQVIASAPEMFDFLMERSIGRRDLSRTAEKAAAAGELLERIGRLEDPVRRDLLVQKLAARLKMDPGALRAGLKRSTPAARPARPEAPPPPSPLRKDACYLVRHLLDQPEAIPRARERLADGLGLPEADRLIRVMAALWGETGRLDATTLRARLAGPEELALLTDAQMMPDPAIDLDPQLESLAAQIQRRRLRERKEDLRRRMRQASGPERERIALELARLAAPERAS